MKAKDLRELEIEELKQKERGFKKDLYDINYQCRVGGFEKTSQFKMLKKNIARVLTIIKEREIENGNNDKQKK